MQLLPILLVAIVMAVDQGLRPVGVDWGLSRAMVAEIAWIPVALVVFFCWLGVRVCEQKLSRGRSPRPIIIADRMVRVARWIIVLNHAVAVLVFGWLETVRSVTGNLVLVDELIAIAPPLLGLIGTWWAYYPIDRRVQEAMLVRRLDDGRPVYPTLSRSQYVVLQIRLNVLLSLLPLMAILASREIIQWATALMSNRNLADAIFSGGTLAVAMAVFVMAPRIAPLALDVQPIAPGALRETLLDVCRRHRVKVREILVWNTNGTMINAAVMGLMGWLRYVLITDALLEMLPEPQVRAVMAHEIGHVRRHHMLWLIGCLLASFILAAELVRWPLFGLDSLGLIRSQWAIDTLEVGSGAAQLIVGLLVFGWICRRFERQADTFAVQHLSGMGDAPLAAAAVPLSPASPLVSVEAVSAMRGALDSIARLNTIDPDRRSWRHGSIAWRMDYLMTIIGRPVTRLRIDRVVRWIKVAVALVLVATAGAAVFDQFHATQNDSDSDLETSAQRDAAPPREPVDAVSAVSTQQLGAMP